jgi:5-deoxy-glucuronate isomerase
MTMLEHRWLFRDTASKKGRNITITPETSDFKYISAGRIILDQSVGSVVGQNPGSETLLLVLHGSGTISVSGRRFDIGRFDGVYVPRGEEFMVQSSDGLDILEASAPTDQTFALAHVRYDDIKDREGLFLKVGAEPYYREIWKVLAENVQGSRLLAGVTMSKPGNWTSWPPHEHAATQEELYLFFDMPRPGFGTQYIYHDLDAPELVAPVYENDAVTIVEGYHPNVAAPGFPINFAWILCSLEEETYRKVGGVNVQPEFMMETGLR